MKKIICILLMLLCFVFPAFAETNPFAPFILSAPPAVQLAESEGTYTFVEGLTRVVAMVIDRVPDEEPADAILRMMAQFEPDAVIGEDVPMIEGYVGVNALNTDQFGEGVDQLTVMILSHEGDLLILSGYDLEGDEDKVRLLLDTLLKNLTVQGEKIVRTVE